MHNRRLLVQANAAGIARASVLLRRGGVVGVPTDTVYGLAAHSMLAVGVEKLYIVKGRERLKAIPLLLARTEDMELVASTVPEWAWRLAERFWPGPVTLVVPRAASVLDQVTGGSPSVAVRVPAHDVALTLIREVGAPLAVTSANLSGQQETVAADEVARALERRVPLILDAGPCPGGVPSTIVDVTGESPVILRRGAVVDRVELLLREGM
jgi:L-threonylcarbamoyladenylate synthase